MRDVFDGRLQHYGIMAARVRGIGDLTDEQANYLSVVADHSGHVFYLIRCLGNSSFRILEAIKAAFNTEIYSDAQPQFYGFKTKEEWDDAMDQEAWETMKACHSNIVKNVEDLPRA